MERPSVKFVCVGHVDHGKSTIIGRLLVDTDSFNQGRLESIKKVCEAKGKEFEYAFLLDALEEERDQGITIDTTQLKFRTDKQDYTIIDAPGHKDFLKNMISGASNADAALLVVDVEEGVEEQTKRHGYILSLLGIKQFYVIMNKMDLVDYSQERYEDVKSNLLDFLGELKLTPQLFIPVSAKLGDNIAKKSEKLSWYSGDTLLGAIDQFKVVSNLIDKPLRMPIQDVYKFDDRRIIAGNLESGEIKKGDTITILPDNIQSVVSSIEVWPEKGKAGFSAGEAAAITIKDDLFNKRGQVIVKQEDQPFVSSYLSANIFWMGNDDLKVGKKYLLKLTTQDIECEIFSINFIIDSSTLEHIERVNGNIKKNEVANVIIKTKNHIVYDLFSDISPMGRFVIVDNLNVAGGGIITEASKELESRERDVKSISISPNESLVSLEERNKYNKHKSKVIWLTGFVGCGKSDIANHLERKLFDEGKQVIHLDTSNIRFGLSDDLDFSSKSKSEHCRRVAEIANFFRKAGFITIVSIGSPYLKDRDYARRLIGSDDFIEVFVNTSIDICMKKNPHGVYTKANDGRILDLNGVNVKYERSDETELVLNIDSEELDMDDILNKIMDVVSDEL